MAGMSAFVLSGLHHVQLAIPAGSEDLARRFYGESLGMVELKKPAVLGTRGGCWFRRGGWEVRLGVETNFRPARKAHPGVLVAGIDKLAHHLSGAGVTVAWVGCTSCDDARWPARHQHCRSANRPGFDAGVPRFRPHYQPGSPTCCTLSTRAIVPKT